VLGKFQIFELKFVTYIDNG